MDDDTLLVDNDNLSTGDHKGRPYYTQLVRRNIVYSRGVPCGRPWIAVYPWITIQMQNMSA